VRRPHPSGTGRLERAVLLSLPVLLVALAYRTAPTFELFSDATFLIRDNPLMKNILSLPGMLTSDFFSSPAGEAIGYWRPLTKASWLLETLLGAGRPGIYHAVQVLWLAVAAAGVQALGRRLGLSLRQATSAALLFALHPAVVEPTSLVMARSDVVCAAGVIWAVCGWLGWRQSGRKGWLILHCISLLVALGSKEAAVVSLPLFLFWSLLPRENEKASPRGLLFALPAAALTFLYIVLRRAVLGSMAETSIELDLLRLVSGGGVYLRGILPLTFQTGVRNISIEEARSAGILVRGIVAWTVLAGACAVCVRRRQWDALALIAWAVGSFTIVLTVGKMRVPGAAGKYALADRWLMQTTAAASLFYVMLAASLKSARTDRIAVAAVALWAGTTVFFAPQIHAPYKNAVTMLGFEDAQFRATPERFRTAIDTCRFAKRDLVRNAAAWNADGALEAYGRLSRLEGCPESIHPELNVLSVLVGLQRYREALPFAERVAAAIPAGRYSFQSLHLAGETFLQTGDARRALPLLRKAAGGGIDSCGLLLSLSQALSALGEHRESGLRMEQAAECGLRQGKDERPDLLLLAAERYLAAGERKETERILEALSNLKLGEADRARFLGLERRLQDEGGLSGDAVRESLP
jgi:tetratricopeptide (TPR) repeat protein